MVFRLSLASALSGTVKLITVKLIPPYPNVFARCH